MRLGSLSLSAGGLWVPSAAPKAWTLKNLPALLGVIEGPPHGTSAAFTLSGSSIAQYVDPWTGVAFAPSWNPALTCELDSAHALGGYDCIVTTQGGVPASTSLITTGTPGVTGTGPRYYAALVWMPAVTTAAANGISVNTAVLFGQVADSITDGLGSEEGGHYWVGATDSSTAGLLDTAKVHLVEVSVDPVSHTRRVYVDGSFVAAATDNASLTSAKFGLGGWHFAYKTAPARIYLAVFCGAVPSYQDRLHLHAYLRRRYAYALRARILTMGDSIWLGLISPVNTTRIIDRIVAHYAGLTAIDGLDISTGGQSIAYFDPANGHYGVDNFELYSGLRARCLIIIGAGTNDISFADPSLVATSGARTALTTAMYASMVAAVAPWVAYGHTVVVCTSPPYGLNSVNGFAVSSFHLLAQQQYNALLRAGGAGARAVLDADLLGTDVSIPGTWAYRLSTCANHDGIHPPDDAIQQLADAAVALIDLLGLLL